MNSAISQQSKNQAHGLFRTPQIEMAFFTLYKLVYKLVFKATVLYSPRGAPKLPPVEHDCVINSPINSIDLQKPAGFQHSLSLQ